MIDKNFSFHQKNSSFEEIVGVMEFHSLTDAVTIKANFEKSTVLSKSSEKELVLYASRSHSAMRKQ